MVGGGVVVMYVSVGWDSGGGGWLCADGGGGVGNKIL